MESGIKHFKYVDLTDSYLDMEEHWMRHRGQKLIYRLNVRSHGDEHDEFVDVIASVKKHKIFDLSRFPSGSSVRVLNQLASPKEALELMGYYLCLGQPLFPSDPYLTSCETVFILIDLEKPSRKHQIRGDIMASYKIAGLWIPMEEGFE